MILRDFGAAKRSVVANKEFPIVRNRATHPGVTNRCVAIFTDNAALVAVINQQTSKHNVYVRVGTYWVS